MKFYGIGTLGRDPELKTVGIDTSVCSFSLACNRKFKSASGEKITDWYNCTSWRKTGEIIAQHFHKGSRIFVEGEIQVRTYEKDGQKHTVTDLIVENFEFVDSKSERSESNNPPAPAVDNGFYPAMDDATTLPFDL